MPSITIYKTASGREPLQDYMSGLQKNNEMKELAKIKLAVDRLAKRGMRINEEYPETVKKIQGELYELRVSKHRILFFSFINDQIVLLHAFRKKTNKTPKKEIEKAFTEIHDHKGRHTNG